MAWAAFVVPTVYRDHQSLAERNQELVGGGMEIPMPFSRTINLQAQLTL
jgi:hypothetical protein